MLETARFSIFYFCVIMINTLALSIAKRRIRIFLTTSMQDALYLSFLIKIKRGFPSMLFNSVVYITIFQPVVIGGWYLLQRLKNPVWSKIFLFGMSLLFYGYYNFYYVGILIASLLLNYGCSILLRKACSDKIRRFILTAGILGNLGILFYFKYFNFFIDNCNFFLHTHISIEKIALPLGISFFTFQQISYIIERFRRNADCHSFLDYGCFITFFPQLIAGPIVMHNEWIPQLHNWRRRPKTADDFYHGAALFILGLAKKVLLADSLAVPVNLEFDNIPYLDAPSAWVTIIFYMMELYFDFSGYCDMARGIGKMMGFSLPVNFRSPLMAVSVRDFWRRWHITLSRFLTQYIYIPLGGNRRGIRRQCFNIFIVFLASGFWHGANWTFVIWGLLHGTAMIAEALFSSIPSILAGADVRKKRFRFPFEKLNRLLTGIFVTLSFSIFRSDSLTDAALLWKKLFAGGYNGMIFGISNTLCFPENYALNKMVSMYFPQYSNTLFLFYLLFLLACGIFFIRGMDAEQWIEKRGKTTLGAFCLATLFTWSFISLSQVSVFLYFNF